jgi:hypothetical protein
MMKSSVFFSVRLTSIIFVSLVLSSKVMAATPDCPASDGSVLPVDDNAAIALKTITANGSTSRAHVEGPITAIYPDETGHNHFQISLDQASRQTLEVVYDIDFGALPSLQIGMNVEACGDFINSYAPENGYQASPDGAIIHWIHRTNSSHPAGFTVINGVLYGQGSGD